MYASSIHRQILNQNTTQYQVKCLGEIQAYHINIYAFINQAWSPVSMISPIFKLKITNYDEQQPPWFGFARFTVNYEEKLIFVFGILSATSYHMYFI